MKANIYLSIIFFLIVDCAFMLKKKTTLVLFRCSTRAQPLFSSSEKNFFFMPYRSARLISTLQAVWKKTVSYFNIDDTMLWLISFLCIRLPGCRQQRRQSQRDLLHQTGPSDPTVPGVLRDWQLWARLHRHPAGSCLPEPYCLVETYHATMTVPHRHVAENQNGTNRIFRDPVKPKYILAQRKSDSLYCTEANRTVWWKISFRDDPGSVRRGSIPQLKWFFRQSSGTFWSQTMPPDPC